MCFGFKSEKRVLALKLTDGVRNVKGMEHVPIVALNPDEMLPGCKIVLLNRIVCRRGVFMLNPGNVRFLVLPQLEFPGYSRSGALHGLGPADTRHSTLTNSHEMFD